MSNRFTLALILCATSLLVTSLLGCDHERVVSAGEREKARDKEIVSFAMVNGAAIVPRISSGVTLDWQRALETQRTYAFFGTVVDIFKKDDSYFLKVADMDHDVRWVIQCSESEADKVRTQQNVAADDLIAVRVAEVHPVDGEDSITEITGTLQKFEPSKTPL